LRKLGISSNTKASEDVPVLYNNLQTFQAFMDNVLTIEEINKYVLLKLNKIKQRSNFLKSTDNFTICSINITIMINVLTGIPFLFLGSLQTL